MPEPPGHTEALYAQRPPRWAIFVVENSHGWRLFDAGNPVKKKPRPPVGTRIARIGSKAAGALPSPAGDPPRTTTWFRHAAQAWARSCLAWVLAPNQDHGHRGPHRGPFMGDATHSTPTEPLQGSWLAGSWVARRPREALAALGIPGLHDASPLGLSDCSPPPALGPVLDSLRISVPSASHQRLMTRLGRE